MRLRTLLALLAAVSAAAMLVIALVLPDPPEVRRRSANPPAAGQGISKRPARPSSAPAPRPNAAGWPTAGLDVRLRETDGREVPDAELRLESVIGPHLAGYEIPDPRNVSLDAKSDEKGASHFESLPVGSYAIEAESPDGRRTRSEFLLAGDHGEIELVLPAAAGWRDLLVRVLDASGAGIAGARVDVFGSLPGARTDAVSEEPALTAQSDGAGIARFEKTELEAGVILARVPDGRSGVVGIRTRTGVDRAMETGGIVLALAEPGSLEGSLTGFPAERLSEARVLAYALDDTDAYAASHGAVLSTPIVDGRYRFDALPAGTWTLSISDPGGSRIVLPAMRAGPEPVANSIDPLEVEVQSGVPLHQDLEVVEGGTIEGLVVTDQGAPVVGALVRDTYAPADTSLPDRTLLGGVNVWRFDSTSRSPGDHPVTHPSTRTDRDGRYRLAGLPPGRHRLEVLAPGLAYDRREGLEVEDGRSTSLEHALEPAGLIQGVEPRAGYLGVTREGREEVLMIALLPEDGRFAFLGLPAGRYTLSRFHSESGQASSASTTVEVEAGRAAWADLTRADGPVRFLGRARDGKGAVPGARVRVHPETFTTDAEGRFEMRSAAPLAGPISVQIARDGVDTWFSLPGMPAGTTNYEKEFVLGDESIRVRTLNAKASPIPARLEIVATALHTPPGDAKTVRFDPVFVDESGERTVHGLLPGEYLVRARFENGSQAQASVSPPEASQVELRMPSSGDLEVHLREPGGAPALGRWISVERWPEDPATRGPRPRWEQTDEDGHASFHGLDTGEMILRVRATRGARSRLDGVLAEKRVTITAEETKTVEIELPER